MEGSRNQLRLTLLTEGDPMRRTGGYLYQQRLAAAAELHNARISFASIARRSFALEIAEIRARVGELAEADVVAIDSILAAATVPWLSRIKRSGPVLAIAHQQPGGVAGGGLVTALRKRLDLQLYRRSDAVVAVSEWLAEQLRTAGVRSERLTVISPGREPIASTGSVAPADLRQGRSGAALCVSNWYANKGVHLVLEAVAKLRPSLVTLHLVGDPAVEVSYGQELLRRVSMDDLRSRVVMHGSLAAEGVGRLLNGADLLVHGSQHEAYGSAIAEGMTAGLPVVAFAVDNLPFLVRNGVDGFLVNYGDVPGMSAAIAVLVTDVQRRQQMASSARARALSWPTWEETAGRFFSLVRELAESYVAIRR